MSGFERPTSAFALTGDTAVTTSSIRAERPVSRATTRALRAKGDGGLM